MSWWLDLRTGFSVSYREGEIREFRHDACYGVKSVQYIHATAQDNPALLESDPDYLDTLKTLPAAERQRLLYGCWK